MFFEDGMVVLALLDSDLQLTLGWFAVVRMRSSIQGCGSQLRVDEVEGGVITPSRGYNSWCFTRIKGESEQELDQGGLHSDWNALLVHEE